jgi:Tfp pilus assembly protein PilO
MKNYIISALIIFLIGLGIMMFLTLPEYEKFVGSTQQLSLDKAELVEREQYLSEMFSLSQRLRQHQPALDKISSALPLYPDFPSLMIFLNEKASESGLIVLKQDMASTVYYTDSNIANDEQAIKPVKFDLLLTGTYPSLKNFIRTVEASSRLINVTEITTAEDKDIGRHLHRITLESFFYQN